jgi:uncharacterized protein (TIGR02266 family)
MVVLLPCARSSDRTELEAEISLASDSQFFTGIARNVSTGGVFVATYRDLPVGARVTMHLTLPEGAVLARGSVRWQQEGGTDVPRGLGIAFDALDSHARRHIERFCAVRMPLYHDEEM